MNFWEQIKLQLASGISTEAFENWVRDTEYDRLENDCLFVRVPYDFCKEWMESEYRDLVRSAIAQLKLPIREVFYVVAPSRLGRTSVPIPPAGFQPSSSPPQLPSPLLGPLGANQLNSKFTFDTFVVGSCNQFAHAAAKAVANKPSGSYNPLFIYGGVGMGKTHLMHAIGLHLLQQHQNMRVVYTSSERFMNEMITCIKTERMTQFQQYYRTADILLIDDIHVLAGKERTQEEFFHTFNELYDHQKQIVISSDSSPKQIPGLVERLRSRFEWGLMVDVQPPDLETKMAILDKKAEAEGVHLPEDVRIFIATKTKSNVRELEGALIKLIAYSSMTGSPITLSMAQQMLKHLIQGGERKVTMDSIIRAVAEHYGLQPSQIKHRTNAHHISFPRQIAMYLAKDLTQASLPEIGRAFGGKHHTTVLHSIQKIESLRHKDPELNNILHKLADSLH
ncbi:MAG: chromosomal replication initiator protein DnaA [Bryobacteraceae bacterium]|nr:chromosomal replication initiator protein DnaA [Bryobacteraceae bacterium]MDW8378883.1 chromosomal replication initiator protein DnaA [Bryobacterales bacterium]